MRPGNLQQVPPVEVPAKRRPCRIERDGADRAEVVAEVIFGSWESARQRPQALRSRSRIRSSGSMRAGHFLYGELFSARADEHHVLAIFEDAASEADGIADAFDGGDRAGFERSAVHEDGVELDAAVARSDASR